ncbi:MAG: hypothetical protein L0206_14090, partial [Actinobacteria bacterium]|nr:hypothetical protein [Actinomycetota bacterium]
MQPRRSRWSVLVALVVLVPSWAWAARTPKSIPFAETGPFEHVDGSGPHRDSHNLLLQARAARLERNAAATNASRDVGDVAVIVDDGTLIIPPIAPSPFDIPAGTTIAFVPGVDEFSVGSSPGGVVADAGADLGLGDDDTTEVALPFAFPFFGVDYASIHVNSDGNITLGSGDSASTPRDAARHIGGAPRISILLADLDPGSDGEVRALVEADRVTVTWDGVPQFGVEDANSFQAVLRADGSVDLNYGSVAAAAGVVGVAEGSNEGPFTEIDFTADLPGTFPAGAIFEEFVTGNPFPQMNTLGVAQRFLETHEDEFDFIVVFADFVVDIGFGAFAFHQGIKNETEGLGFFVTGSPSNQYDFTAFLENAATGPIDELESVLNMNRIGLYWGSAENMVDPPIRKFRFFCLNVAGQVVPCGATLDGPPGASQTSRRARWFGTLQGDFGGHGAYTLGLNSAMSLMGQEAGHRWLAFPAFVHPGGFLSADLLGRSLAHWSFFFDVGVPDEQFGGDPRASSAEGNAILDLGPDAFPGQLPMPCLGPESTFLTEPDELIDGF